MTGYFLWSVMNLGIGKAGGVKGDFFLVGGESGGLCVIRALEGRQEVKEKEMG